MFDNESLNNFLYVKSHVKLHALLLLTNAINNANKH